MLRSTPLSLQTLYDEYAQVCATISVPLIRNDGGHVRRLLAPRETASHEEQSTDLALAERHLSVGRESGDDVTRRARCECKCGGV
jgi:hypothetical protein